MIHSIVGHDGSARIELDGRTVKIREHSVDAARDKVHELAIQYAAETGVMQYFKATDPLGTWPMYVYPNGTTVPAPADVTPPVPRPPLPIPEAYRKAAQQRLIAEETPQPLMRPQPALEHNPLEGIDHTVVVARAAARPTLVVHLDTGETATAAAPVVIGRRPKALPGHTAVTVTSPGRETSRIHAVVDIDAEGRLIVTDQDTPNGTRVNDVALEPHRPTIVSPGARLELGDAVVHIEVLVPMSYTDTGSGSGTGSSTAVAHTHKEQES